MMTPRTLILIVVFLGLGGLWFWLNQGSSTDTSGNTKPMVKNAKSSKKQTDVSQDEIPALPDKNPEPLSSDEAKMMLVGIWRIDLTRLEDDPEIKNAPEEERAEALKIAQRMMSNVAFEFAQDGTMNVFLSSNVRRGTYEVKATNKNVLTLNTKTGEGESVQVVEYEVTVAAENIVLTDKTNQITRYLVRGAPPRPEQPPQAP